MKILFLISIILTLAVVQGERTAGEAPNIEPCQKRAPDWYFDDFVKRHVLIEKFDRKDKNKWGSYLNSSGLCNRGTYQSFMDAELQQVKSICTRAGRRVQGATGPQGNWCMSQSSMKVYKVWAELKKEKCIVKIINLENTPVVVGCDKVGKYCRPVHYEWYTGQVASDRPCP